MSRDYSAGNVLVDIDWIAALATTITLTQAEADSIAAGNLYRLRLERVTGDGGDTMTGDAQVLRVIVRQ